MKIAFTASFQKKAAKLCHSQPHIRAELSKQLTLFQTNPRHPGLRLHKLQGKRSTQLAVWIEGNLRALVIRDQDTYIFFDLIGHDHY